MKNFLLHAQRGMLNERLLAFGLFVGGVGMSPQLSLGFTLPKWLVFEGLFIVLIALAWFQKRSLDALWKTRTGRLVLAYFGMLTVYTIFSIAPWTSFWGAASQYQGLITQVLYLSAFCIGMQSKSSLSRTLIPMNAGIVAYGLIQMAGLDPFAHFWEGEAALGRTYSTLGNPNFLGAFLVLTWPCIWKERHRGKGAMMALLLANGVVLAGAASRGAFIALVGSIAMAVFLYKKELQTLVRSTWKTHRKTWAGALIATLFLGWLALNQFQERYVTTADPGRSLSARQIIWEDSLELIRQHPWGYGLETLSLIYGSVQNPELLEYEKFTVFVDRAHNIFLDLWIAAGPLTVLIWTFLVGRLLFFGFQKKETRMETLGLFGYGLTLMVSFESLVPSVIAWLLLGSVFAATEGRKSINRTTPSGSRIFWGALFVGLCLTFVSTLQHTRADLYYTQGEQYVEQQDLKTALNAYTKAIDLYPYDRVYLLKATEVFLVGMGSGDNDGDPWPSQHREAIEEALLRLEELTQSNDPFTHLLLGWWWALALSGDADNVAIAKTEIETGIALAPSHPITYKIAGHVYFLLGDEEAGEKAYAQLVALLPTYLEDETSDATRIFWKENGWLIDLIVVK